MSTSKNLSGKNSLKDFKFDGIVILRKDEAYLGEHFHYEENVNYYSYGLGILAIHWHFKKKNDNI